MSASKLPAYEHVKAFVKAKTNLGAWRAGDSVPSESALQQFGVSRMTVSRALRELVVKGLVTRVRGLGTVVAQLHRILSTLALRDIHEEVVERGHAHATQVMLLESICANAALGQILKPLTEASYSIEACLPSPQKARRLRIKRSEPCLVMTPRTISGLHVASLMRLVYPGMHYSFGGKVQL